MTSDNYRILRLTELGIATRISIKYSTGNVGIGMTTPQGKLDDNTSIYQRGSLLHVDYVFLKRATSWDPLMSIPDSCGRTPPNKRKSYNVVQYSIKALFFICRYLVVHDYQSVRNNWTPTLTGFPFYWRDCKVTVLIETSDMTERMQSLCTLPTELGSK